LGVAIAIPQIQWISPRELFYTAHSDGAPMDANSTVKLIAGLLAVLLIAIVFLRRKKKKGAAEDEF
jgi:LPXTG-motif cell wall-anchored protein